MLSLLFPTDPTWVNYGVWLLIAGAMLLWLSILKRVYGPKVHPITSRQHVGERLTMLQIVNQEREERGLIPLTDEEFFNLEEKMMKRR
ncbi:hypothetical protein GMRT_11080 [Giardia muris]|uniref:Uncharacterized protein n=1 Tax=Giardia muris TaxID=5742 RepID=A0A4Z1TC41_GIAMU|nr:hypothetical protein GMRT_11080 [Giardia muris]|eukprot:TNJ30119.1 hypothetical protein GMRT_11080 [Giardia muris]